MKRSRITSLIAMPAVIGVVRVPLLVAQPALGDAQTRNLTIHTLGVASETCVVPGPGFLCADLKETSNVTSNLAGQGTWLEVVRTFDDNGCSAGVETTTFTFDDGTISTQTLLETTDPPENSEVWRRGGGSGELERHATRMTLAGVLRSPGAAGAVRQTRWGRRCAGWDGRRIRRMGHRSGARRA